VRQATPIIAAVVAAAAAAGVHGLLEGYRLLQHSQAWTLHELSGALAMEVVSATALVACVFVGVVLAGLKPKWLAVGAVLGAASLQLAARVLHPVPADGLPPPTAAAVAGTTVVLITTDTLRRDHVSAYPDSGDLTPHLAAIAAKAVRFDDAVSTAPLTLPSHTSMLSGVSPTEHGVYKNGMVLPADLRGVPEALAEAGFYTGAFTSSLILHGSHGMRSWFHVYRDALGTRIGADKLLLASLVSSGADWARDAPEDKIGKEPGPVTVARALVWLDGVPPEAPVFLWVHLYDAHSPFGDTEPDPVQRATVVPCDWSAHPAALRRTPWHPVRPMKPPIAPTYKCKEASWNKLVARISGYRGAVSYLDQQVGALVAGLDDAGRWENAGVVVVADHGESLYEHQQHVSHQYSLYDPVIRVPLFVRAPGETGVRTEPVSTVRVAATLRDLAGLPPDPSIAGPSLLDVGEDRPISVGPAAIDRMPRVKGAPVQVVARWGGLKVLLDEAGHAERYDLAVDPGERRPGLTEEEREASRAIIQERVTDARPRHLLMAPPGSPPRLATASALRQDGVLGRLVSEDEAADYLEHEEQARRALQDIRSRAMQAPAEDGLPDEIQRALEALGYAQ